jgi:WD40 repeat protein
MKALEKDRNRRYETAAAFVADVQRYLHDEPVLARSPSAWYRFRKYARRHRWALALASVVATALVVIAVGSLIAALFLNEALHESEANRLRAEGAEQNAKEAAQAAITSEKSATERLYGSLVAQARASRLSRRSGQRFKSLEALADAARIARRLNNPGKLRIELRTEAIAALCVADLEMDREVGSEIVGVEAVTIDAAFQHYAFADKDGKVSIRRLCDNRELLQLPGAGAVSVYEGLGFSPDGPFLHQRCQVAKGFQSRLWDLRGLEPKAVLDDEHSALAFRPDGRQCAASYRDGTIRLLETASGQELRRFRVDLDLTSDHGLWWNPKQPRLLIGTRRSQWLLDLDTGKVTRVGPTLPGGYDWVEWHPEGRILAVSGSINNQQQIHLWDVPAGRPVLPALLGHNSGGVTLRFNHAGDRLLSTDWSGSGKLWDTRSGRLLLSLPISMNPPYFSRDDGLVGTGALGKIRLHRFHRGEELSTLVRYESTSKGGFRHINSGLDPTGRLCAFYIHGLGIALVDLVRCEEVALLPLPANMPVRFDRDGALWTGGPAGLLRWPASDDHKTGQRRYGPPQKILQQTPSAGHGSSPDLGVVAIPQPFSLKGALVFHRDSKRLHRLGPQEDVRWCAVSPDGRWVATGSHWLGQGAGAKVWDARDGRHVKDLPVGGFCSVQFSPDGKWLLTTGGGPRLWAVGAWEKEPKLAGTSSNPLGAFSCDGKLLAVGDEPGVVRLLVADTGKELARLTAPEQARLEPCVFTADGTKLVATTAETGALLTFDVAAIRAGLAELDLDWDAPPLPAVSKGVPPPLSISFDLGDLRHWAEADTVVQEAARQVSGNEHAKARAPNLRQ